MIGEKAGTRQEGAIHAWTNGVTGCEQRISIFFGESATDDIRLLRGGSHQEGESSNLFTSKNSSEDAGMVFLGHDCPWSFFSFVPQEIYVHKLPSGLFSCVYSRQLHYKIIFHVGHTEIFVLTASHNRVHLCPPASSVHNLPPFRSHLDSTH